MKLENYIILKYLKQSYKNKNIFTSSVTAVSVIAIAIIFYISAVSLMNGYVYGLLKISLEVESFHLDYPSNNSIKTSKIILKDFMKDKRVLYADVYGENKVILSSKNKTTGLIYFRSVPDNIFANDHALNKSLHFSKGSNKLEKNNILISEKTAEKLGISLNEYVYLTASSDKYSSKLVFKRLKVTGIFTSGFVELDEQLAYISLETSETIFNKNSYRIFIKLKNYNDADNFYSDFADKGYYSLTTWQEKNYNKLTSLNFQKNIIALIVTLILLTAVLNILTTVFITVFEKQKDIGILKSFGLKPHNVFTIFLLNGIYLGFVGTFIGVVLGLIVKIWLNDILISASDFLNFFNNLYYQIFSKIFMIQKPEIISFFSKDFYLDKIYTEISIFEVATISFLSIIFSTISSIIPAVKAKNLKPQEIIKGIKQ